MNENKERFLIRFLNDKYFIRLYKKMGKEERREIRRFRMKYNKEIDYEKVKFEMKGT